MQSFSIYVKPEKQSNNKLFKLHLIFYKKGYSRIPKVLNIEGKFAHWNEKNKIFNSKDPEAKKKNAEIATLIAKYAEIGDLWDKEGRNWSPKELSHYFEVEKKLKAPKTKILSIEDLIEERINFFTNRKRVVNGVLKSSETNAKNYRYLLNSLRKFTSEYYKKSFSFYHFKDINEEFLNDFVIHTKQLSNKAKGNKRQTKENNSGLPHKLSLLLAVCRYAKKKNIFLFDETIFECVEQDKKKREAESRAVAWDYIQAIENLDKSEFKEYELIDIDLFLFSCYVGGMSNIDVCHLKHSMILGDRIVYQRQKTSKKAEPLIPEKGKRLIEKYKHRAYADYVFPVFLPKHTTERLKYNRSEYITRRVNTTLEKVRKLIKCKDPIKWYTARGSYITALVNGGENMGVVAKQAGNTAAIITKHYYKNTEQTKSLHRLNKLFGSDVKVG